MTEIPSTAIEAATHAIGGSLMNGEGWNEASVRCIAKRALEASGLPTDLQAAQEQLKSEGIARRRLAAEALTVADERDTAQERAERAETAAQEMAQMWRELRCDYCKGYGAVDEEGGQEDCPRCDGSGVSQELIVRAEKAERAIAAARQTANELDARRDAVETERDQFASQLQEAREIIGNLRTAAREVCEFFDFAAPGLSEFAGHDLEGCEGDPTTALLSLHDFANDADRFLSETEPKP